MSNIYISIRALRLGLRALASLRLTLVVLILLVAGVVGVAFAGLPATWVLAPSLGLFLVNLTAAIFAHPAFRRQVPLLIFHLALLALVALLVISRLTYLKGHLELAQGETFRGKLTGFENGLLHPWHLKTIAFRQRQFSIHYDPGRQRGHTRSHVQWFEGGSLHSGIIGDQQPLVLAGYRFYTTPNKGFAPVFTWYPANGEAAHTGSIHLPSYPAHELGQTLKWRLPGTPIKLQTTLSFTDRVLDPQHASRFQIPKHYRLLIRFHAHRYELQPGGGIDLPTGRLVFEGLRTWMGYQVFYDWTMPWLLAACMVAVISLMWHYACKFAAHPWREDSDTYLGVRSRGARASVGNDEINVELLPKHDLDMREVR